MAIPVIRRNPSRCQIRDLDTQFLRGPSGAVAIRHFLLKRTDSHRKCRLTGGIFCGNDGGGLHFETVPFSFFAEFQSISPISDGRRMMDKEMGWFHPCSSWPLTDLKIKIPIL
jgi:hypothetical protein